ncbi:hypothetical protein KCU74_g76, partial [Aureobasidium melanogenum]
MRSVRYSQRNNHGQDTDTKTSDETTTVNVVDILSACLNDDTDHEDNNTNLSGDLTTELVGVVSVDQYTNPCSEFEDAAQLSETYYMRCHVQNLPLTPEGPANWARRLDKTSMPSLVPPVCMLKKSSDGLTQDVNDSRTKDDLVWGDVERLHRSYTRHGQMSVYARSTGENN